MSEGDLIDVERRSGEVGQAVDFQEVLLVGDQETIHVGRPVLAGARVVGTIAEQGKEAKIIVFKFKRRKKYRKNKAIDSCSPESALIKSNLMVQRGENRKLRRPKRR